METKTKAKKKTKKKVCRWIWIKNGYKTDCGGIIDAFQGDNYCPNCGGEVLRCVIPSQNQMTLKEAIILLMIRLKDWSFDWQRHEKEIKSLKDKEYLIWEPYSMAIITTKGLKRIEKILQ
jgi:hypothetical protein